MAPQRGTSRAERHRSRGASRRAPAGRSVAAGAGRTGAGRTGAGQTGAGAAVRTRRLVVLALLGVVCTVTLAPYVRLYVDQERQQAAIRTDIVRREAAIADLERQQQLWRDDAFVAAQARQRLNYAFPGETTYVVSPELLAAAAQPATGGPGATAGVPSGGPSGAAEQSPWYRQLWAGFAGAAAAEAGADAGAEADLPR